MKAIDITRLKEAAQFIQENEKFTTEYNELTITLSQSKEWLHIGMRWNHNNYQWGRNLSLEMQRDDNFEYWVFSTLRHMNSRK